MPLLIAAIWAVLRGFLGLVIRYAGPWLLQGLLFFGLSFVAQSYVSTPILDYIKGALSGAPAMVISAFAAVGFDRCVTIIISAHVAAAAGRLVLRKTPA